MAAHPVFKIIIAGSANSGKTCFVHRHLTGEFVKTYVPTLVVEVRPLILNTTQGKIIFNLWDLAGKSSFGSKGDDDYYYQGAQGLLVFYDASASTGASFNEAMAVIQNHPGLPAVLCGSKADINGDGSNSWAPNGSVLEHHKISAKSNYNYEKPFLALARALTGDSTLKLTEDPVFALTPPTAQGV